MKSISQMLKNIQIEDKVGAALLVALGLMVITVWYSLWQAFQ